MLITAVPHEPLAAQAAAERDAAPALALPADVRAAALGGAATAVRGAQALFANPATLAPGYGLDVSRHDAAATGLVLRAAASGAGGTFALGVQALDFGAECADVACSAGLPPVSPGRLGRGGPVPATSAVVAVGYAREVRGLRAGVVAKYVEQRFAGEGDGTAAVDLGVAHAMDDVTVGLAVRNLGGRLTTASGAALDLPTTITVGAATGAWMPSARWPYLDLSAAADAGLDLDGDVVAGGGVEAAYVPVEGIALAARAGARVPRAGEQALTLGAGARWDAFTLDYAFHPTDGAGGVHRLGVGWRPR